MTGEFASTALCHAVATSKLPSSTADAVAQRIVRMQPDELLVRRVEPCLEHVIVHLSTEHKGEFDAVWTIGLDRARIYTTPVSPKKSKWRSATSFPMASAGRRCPHCHFEPNTLNNCSNGRFRKRATFRKANISGCSCSRIFLRFHARRGQ